MDVDSVGMVDFEILTRERVFAGAAGLLQSDVALRLIMTKELKPETSFMVEVKKSLMRNRNESAIFHELEKIVKQCWQTNSRDRLKIFAVKQHFYAFAQDKQTYDKASDTEIKVLIEKRKLQSLCFLPLEAAQSKRSYGKENDKKAEIATKQKKQLLLAFGPAQKKQIHGKEKDKKTKTHLKKKKRKLSSVALVTTQNKQIYGKASYAETKTSMPKEKRHPPVFKKTKSASIKNFQNQPMYIFYNANAGYC